MYFADGKGIYRSQVVIMPKAIGHLTSVPLINSATWNLPFEPLLVLFASRPAGKVENMRPEEDTAMLEGIKTGLSQGELVIY